MLNATQIRAVAIRIAGIFDEADIKYVDPISYCLLRGNDTYYRVYLTGKNKIYDVTFKEPLDPDDPTSARGCVDIYRFRNIHNIFIDSMGCVITLNGGKKIELLAKSLEGPEDFEFSARGLLALWDEYDG